MKKLSLIPLLCLLSISSAWGENYPTPLMEQVNINPEGYIGFTVKFLKGELEPDPEIFDSYKDFNFEDAIYCYWIFSKDGNLFYSPTSIKSEISFYSSKALAVKILYSGLDLSTEYKFNLICHVEKTTGLNFYERDEPYYLCRILVFELLDDNGNVIETYHDDGMLPSNPLLERWDVGLDGKIGLPEAIRALQVGSGIREE